MAGAEESPQSQKLLEFRKARASLSLFSNSSAADVDSFKTKDVAEWTSANVSEFLKEALPPGHPCLASFRYNTGFVLDSLSRDDLRRQAKLDEKAGDTIWSALLRFRREKQEKEDLELLRRVWRGQAPASLLPSRNIREGVVRPPPATRFTVKVLTPAPSEAIELECSPSETMRELKIRLAEAEGTPVGSQRLVWNGINTHDARTLASLNISHGAVLRLVRQVTATELCEPPPPARAPLTASQPGVGGRDDETTAPELPSLAEMDLAQKISKQLGAEQLSTSILNSKALCFAYIERNRHLLLEEINRNAAKGATEAIDLA